MLSQKITHPADMLAKKGLLDSSRCTLCYNHIKDVDHLFISCSFSGGVWFSLQRGYNKTLPADLNDLWYNWRTGHRFKKLQKSTDILAAIACWTLWKEHNNKIFRLEARTGNEVHA